MFVGFVDLGDTLNFCLQALVSDLPTNADAYPTFRVYSSAGALSAAAGAATFRQTGTITAASNLAPIVVTSVGHGLQTGMRVNITGVLGNTAANSTWTVTRVTADTFSLDGSTGNGAYASGGTWRVAGLYNVAVAATGASGFTAGETYTVHVSYTIGGVAYAQVFALGVV